MVDYNIIILIGAGLLIIILVWLLIRFIKSKTKISKIPNNPPEEILKELDYATQEFERRNIESNGNSNPYEILYEISKRNRVGRTTTSSIGQQSSTTTGELSSVNDRGQSIQSESTSRTTEDIRQPISVKPNSNRNFFSKFKRK